MTKKEAKRIALDMWRELAEKGSPSKKATKAFIAHGIDNMSGHCPLCEVILNEGKRFGVPAPDSCSGCPLESCQEGSSHDKWCSPHLYAIQSNCSVEEVRKKYAQEIVEKVEAWEV